MTTQEGEGTPPILERRPLGTTGLTVPPICVGCAPLGSMPTAFGYAVAEEQALVAYRAILSGPIPFLDTAASYGDGESERRLGLALRERGGLPEAVVVATKADRDLRTGAFDGDQIRRSVERSLRLLGLDRLQICYLHDPELTTFAAAMAPDGPVNALRQCKEEGLVEHIGVAGGPIDLMIRYVETGLFEVAISHNRFTLLDRSADALWDVCGRRKVAALNAAPYGGGMLARGPRAYPRYAYRQADDGTITRALRLEAICARHGVPLAAAALQFSLRDARIASTIVGIDRPELLAQTMALARHPIPASLWAGLASIRPTTGERQDTPNASQSDL